MERETPGMLMVQRVVNSDFVVIPRADLFVFNSLGAFASAGVVMMEYQLIQLDTGLIVVAGLSLLAIAMGVLWLWMLIDCAMNEPSEGNDKIVWILIILFTTWIGALIYFTVRRPKRIRVYGQ